MARVFQEEVKGAEVLAEKAEQVFSAEGYFIELLFANLDKDKKGFLDIRDFYSFMSEYLGSTTYLRAERVLRRLDLDCDGKISPGEFEFGLTGVVTPQSPSQGERE